jgi:hypothetical protein
MRELPALGIRHFTGIETYAFSRCTNLRYVNIPGGVASIEEYTFSGCISLQSITIPDGITRIEDKAFFRCESLKTVYLSRKTRIGKTAFKQAPAEFFYTD